MQALGEVGSRPHSASPALVPVTSGSDSDAAASLILSTVHSIIQVIQWPMDLWAVRLAAAEEAESVFS